MEADESYFVLNPATYWQPVEIVERWAVTVNFIKENSRRAKDSITVTKLRIKEKTRVLVALKESCFLQRGLTAAAFTREGNRPVVKNWFTMAVSRGTISSEHPNTKDVEIGSRTHALGDICFMSLALHGQYR